MTTSSSKKKGKEDKVEKNKPKKNKETEVGDSDESGGELFFNKRLPKDYTHSTLSSEIKDKLFIEINKIIN